MLAVGFASLAAGEAAKSIACRQLLGVLCLVSAQQPRQGCQQICVAADQLLPVLPFSVGFREFCFEPYLVVLEVFHLRGTCVVFGFKHVGLG